MLRIGVMVSGGGTNLQAILDRIEDGTLKNCSVVTVVSSNSEALAIERAKRKNIPVAVISRKSFDNEEDYNQALIAHMKKYGVELVVLAGFLSRLGESFINEYKNAIINVHPSLIPAFCGKGYYGIIPHRKALEYGVKITGATVHFVEPEYDSGPIILQKAVEVLPDDTPETLQKRVMEQAEWIILPEAIRLFSEGKLEINGRKVIIRDTDSE
ncbi:phosphoribosylglycinamide formyltransferase PurN [Thermoclostridium stercorarium subsp. stercorarium DSM 8532]|jgi:phosphoribosylglycinamide formyltransferase-1|uniref:Phosphoribosylglycinamide formyltransferase n=3 Tax=Thermoclostridium stercorarium TaxID=1510 RepID=L7VQZ0_THES1|nr:phosphoribosylglycinamide formyltransferase [Thermoclostridium stercorarium]AGC69094.1 phosphoribosylglycinamide formyltransferase PurN [Thermoclostridium stercorarium subsp. stercorarium DSM 8532]AGI40066.1 formyltetrahydrofolate-dependent phosphoribosylglycinamide formyltransferase [Thermoclostridium stercorarium subsp. stercorarium DSM 8532]ANW99384.1 phosphoribosylglycinamide formyltransferase [Thermoclostridium stercorarium subsp. thermolacticum DSM 2910]ANX02013.1 phosphoribosylglycina